MYTYFEIGPVRLRVSLDYELPWKNDVKIFQVKEPQNLKIDMNYTIDFEENFSPIWGTVLYHDNAMMIMDVNGIEHRIYFLPQYTEPYALTKHITSKKIEIVIDKKFLPFLKWDRNLIGLFSLEHVCLPYNSFLLHSSFIIKNGKAILFTAPSGTGKSTQADLWAKYEDAKIINGDRTLLVYKNGVWYATGFPVCGSSEYCLNESAPIEAIICLEQGKCNLVNQLSTFPALKKIYSQAFVNTWNSDDCNMVFSLISSFIQSVPVYHYSCTKDKDAVTTLKDFIHSQQSTK